MSSASRSDGPIADAAETGAPERRGQRAEPGRALAPLPGAETGSETETDDPSERLIHATAVAAHGRAVVLLGPSGSGKSAFALELIAHGARLVADDRCLLRRRRSGLAVLAPGPLAGLIEARHVGLLRLDHLAEAPLALAVDMAEEERERLPPHRTTALLGRPVALLRRAPGTHFAHAVLHCLAGRRLDPDHPGP